MVSRFSDAEKLRQAKHIAHAYGLFIADKSYCYGRRLKTEYVVYRSMPTYNVRLGVRHSISGLWDFIIKLTGWK